MRKLSKSNRRKAQFFIISAVTIVVLIFLVSQWIQPSTIVDTSAVVLREETFVFSNIKEKAISAAMQSKTCDDLFFNLDEYKNFAEQYAASKGFGLNFAYTISACSITPQSTTINFDVNLKSFGSAIASTFSLKWP